MGKARYCLLFKDGYSQFRTVCFLKRKNEASEQIQNFVRKAEKTTGNKMKILRSDNGGEFVNREMDTFLGREGIVHQTSVPHTPQQNGKAERELRTIVEAARTMLHAKSLGKELWAEAINTAEFTLNRTGPSPVADKTPFELWTGEAFDVNLLKTFGSQVYIHIPKVNRKKWDPKSEEGIFVGYGEATKGFRVYMPDSGEVKIARDVVFIEESQKVHGEAINSAPIENDQMLFPSDHCD